MTDQTPKESPDDRTETPRADDVENPETSPAGREDGAQTNPVEGIRRTKQLRQRLLTKLPQLVYVTWKVKDNFRIDEEWSGVVNLQADALLGSLEAAAPEQLR